MHRLESSKYYIGIGSILPCIIPENSCTTGEFSNTVSLSQCLTINLTDADLKVTYAYIVTVFMH